MSPPLPADGRLAENRLYDYVPITDRRPLAWPNGARVAVYVGLNIEHFHLDKPSTSIWAGTTHLQPDPLNYGWRDYGNRVGIWRLIEIFDRHGAGLLPLRQRRPRPLGVHGMQKYRRQICHLESRYDR